MHIFATHIKNFRRFKQLTVYPNPTVNFVIGANNAGKSSLLRAIDLALNPSHNSFREDLIGHFDFYHCRTEVPIEIWIYFELPRTDQGELITRFGNRLSRWLLSGTCHLVESPTKDVDATGLPFEAMTKSPLEEESHHVRKTIELLATRFRATWNKETAAIDMEWQVIDEVGEPSHFSQTDRRAIAFTLIPTQRDPLQVLGFSRRSLLGKLLDNSEIAGPLRSLVREIDELKVGLDETESMKTALRTVTETLNDLHLTEGPGETEATVTFLKTEINQLRSALELALRTVLQAANEEAVEFEGKESFADVKHLLELPLSHQGDGAQNSLLLSVLLANKTKPSQAINGIEEPERSLEPWRARALAKRIVRPSSHQSFLTTHSPAILGEVQPENLLLLNVAGPKVRDLVSPVTVINGGDISQSARKEFEHYREAYARCLFSRLVLIVEGTSEMGFLPTALTFAAKLRGSLELSALGLEIYENQGSKDMELRARNLAEFGKQSTLLLDYDEETTRSGNITELRIQQARTAGDVLIWGRKPILEGAMGCDLEVILAKESPISLLAQSLKQIYLEAQDEHPIDEMRWNKAKKVLRPNHPLAMQVPEQFPDPNSYFFENLDEGVARLTLLCLMHEPHKIKSARDMRRLAELLESQLPQSVLNLYDRLSDRLSNITSTHKHSCYDLHERIAF